MVKVLSHINAFGLKKGEVGELSEVDGMEVYFKAGYLERLDDVELELASAEVNDESPEPKARKPRRQKAKSDEPSADLFDGDEGD